jgi:hypothetical protein
VAVVVSTTPPAATPLATTPAAAAAKAATEPASVPTAPATPNGGGTSPPPRFPGQPVQPYSAEGRARFLQQLPEDGPHNTSTLLRQTKQPSFEMTTPVKTMVGDVGTKFTMQPFDFVARRKPADSAAVDRFSLLRGAVVRVPSRGRPSVHAWGDGAIAAMTVGNTLGFTFVSCFLLSLICVHFRAAVCATKLRCRSCAGFSV